MALYKCKLCGYMYSEEKGDAERNIPAGTKFDEFPESFKCPNCGVAKKMFMKIE